MHVLLQRNTAKFQGGRSTTPTDRVNLIGNNIESEGRSICGTFKLRRTTSILKPLPAITRLPLGAPGNPNVARRRLYRTAGLRRGVERR